MTMNLSLILSLKALKKNGIIYPLDKILDIDGHEVVSFEYVNPTPWDTPEKKMIGSFKE